MKEEMMMGESPEASIEVEINQAEGEEEGQFAEMAPKGRFSAKALNNLVKATNRLLPMFDQTPDYPEFSSDITEFPTDFVRVLSMFKGAVDDAIAQGLVDEQYSFDFGEITGDGNIQVLAGKINKLASDNQFKRYLKQKPTEEPQGEEMAMAEESAPMDSGDMDALFMERM
jgi:uncharacterized protein YdbL (DUF1318 family)